MSKVSSTDKRGAGKGILAVFFVLAMSSCQSGAGDQAYADGFKASMEAFRETAIEIETRPLPSTQGLTREQKLIRLAERMREDARAWQKCAESFKRLNPPPRFEEVNRRSIALLQQMGEDHSQFADRVVTGSPDMDRFKRDFDKHMLANLRQLSEEVSRIGGREATQLEASIKEIEEMAPKG